MAENTKNSATRTRNTNGQYFNLETEKAFFEEVDEEVRNEKFKQLINKYGGFILFLLILALSVVVGYEKIGEWRVRKAEQKNVQYVQALAANPDFENSIIELENFIATEKGLYKDMARLHVANILLENNQLERGLDYLKQINTDENVSEKIKEISIIKSATYLIDTSSYTDIETLLNPILQNSNSAWQQMAQELLAMSAIQNKDYERAKNLYQSLLKNEDISEEFKARINDMLASINDAQNGNM